MNKKEYIAYEIEVKAFLRENDVIPGCFGPKSDDSEPYFSWQNCDCCKSELGGNRENYVFVTNQMDKFEAEICTDCIYYLTYGRLDDSQMMEIENEIPNSNQNCPS